MNVSYDHFLKLDIRIGQILTAEKIEGADKLLKLQVDFGPEIGHRQIVSGISQWYKPAQLIGAQAPFVINLEPRVIRGVASQGMILAAAPDNKAVILKPRSKVAPGTKVR